MRRKISAGLCLILFALGLVACQFPGFSQDTGPVTEQQQINTAYAQTLSSIATDIAAGRNPTIVGPRQATPTFTLTPIPAQSQLPPTQSPVPGATETPLPGPDCNRATFVGDTTFPDGATILPGSTLTKTWELKNSGTCIWTPSYSVVFAGRGTAMGAEAKTALISSGEVKPGESAKVSVIMHAPSEPGDYEGYWMLRSPDNQTFGTGAKGAAPFFVKLHVAKEFTFAEQGCLAKWQSSAGDLPCPGADGDSHGFVLPGQNPVMEDNQAHEGPGWVVQPQPVAGGWIVGKFPAVMVPEHSDFRATVSCTPNESGCYIKFKITYQVDNGSEQVLGEWNEGADGNVTEIIKDLNMVSGRNTAFNFYLYVNGAPDQSKGVWFNPRIVQN